MSYLVTYETDAHETWPKCKLKVWIKPHKTADESLSGKTEGKNVKEISFSYLVIFLWWLLIFSNFIFLTHVISHGII